MITGCRVEHDAYFDSVVLMRISAELNGRPEVGTASLMMGTDANKQLLRDAGLLTADGAAAAANDLVIAISAADDADLDALIETARGMLASGAAPTDPQAASRRRPRTIREVVSDAAAAEQPPANLALISTPGAYAAAEALKALRLGLHVFMFSDNVPLEHEQMLKREATRRGLLVMGPDCGTAVINGVPLGFANAVRPGDIGLIGASGTGLQQISTLIDRGGAGVSQIVGVGGRDLSAEVGATSMLAALEALAADAGTAAIVLVSKPPAEAVAARVLAAAAQVGKPVVVCFLGADVTSDASGVQIAPTLEDAARAALALRGVSDAALSEEVEVAARPDPARHLLRALYTGGTFAYEADLLLADALGELDHALPGFVPGTAAELPERHLVLDLGGDEFTVGRPHPMIDPSVRLDVLAAAADSPETAAIVLDVVLGHGSAVDPVGPLLPLLERIREQPGGPVVVAFVVGTAQDSQDAVAQERRLRDAGVVLAPSSTAAARIAREVVVAQLTERSVS